MKLRDEVVERLAAEYVLGTLRGLARHRFQHYMRESARVRQEVWFWEAQLGLMLSAVPSGEALPARHWQRLEQRLWGIKPASSAGWWRWWGAATMAASLLLVIAVWWGTPQDRAPVPALATILQSDGMQYWSLALSEESGQLRINSLQVKAADAGLDYELWIVPENSAPVSLGTIRPAQSAQTLQLTAEQLAALKSQLLLAVSLEPAGGSPVGAPTGPVLYTGVLVPI